MPINITLFVSVFVYLGRYSLEIYRPKYLNGSARSVPAIVRRDEGGARDLSTSGETAGNDPGLDDSSPLPNTNIQLSVWRRVTRNARISIGIFGVNRSSWRTIVRSAISERREARRARLVRPF